jgi:hypothetical protein
MSSVTRAVRQKVIAAAAVAVLLAGGAVAAVSATGHSSHAKRHGLAARARVRDLATAAAYLGISPARLSSELASGRSLAQVAQATGDGRSAQGLGEALQTAKQAKLATIERSLPARVSAELRRPGGPLGGARLSPRARVHVLFTRRRRLADAAVRYLATTPSALAAELASGRTLAQVAAATPGKTPAGLIAALVAAEWRAPAVLASAQRLSPQLRAARQERFQRRATRLVARRFAGARPRR